jgi:uncharacterized protein (DUF2236 family)
MERDLRIATARHLGESAAHSTVSEIRSALRRQVRASIGVRQDPPPPCEDPTLAYFSPGSIVRQVHADLPSMLIGGLSSLLFQMLHPLAMAGVAQHSKYRDDPLGRLERTAFFLGITTFGSNEQAARTIKAVHKIHGTVRGTAADGRAYSANDPSLLTWVHATEVHSFLAATTAYGPHRLDAESQDRYVDQMAKVALDLGAVDVPRSVAELTEYFAQVRPELEFTPEAREARNFVLFGVRRWPHEAAAYGTLIAAAQGILPPWARRQLRLVSVPASNRLIIRPVALGVCTTLRWIARPDAYDARVRPPSTVTT